MKTLDDLLLDVGKALDEMSAAHEPAARFHPPARRTRWVALAAAGLVAVAGTVAVIAVSRDDDAPGFIESTQPVDTRPEPTTVDSTDAPAVDSTAPPTSEKTAATTPATSLESVLAGATPLDDIGPDGAPVVPTVVPDGYRLVMAGYGEGAAGGFTIAEPGGWAATYIDPSAAATPPVPTISVQITPLEGAEVYELFPWAPGSPDVQIGPFTGRIANGEPVSITAVIPLDGDRRLVISGSNTTRTAIETIAGGLRLRDDGVGADATILPLGFEFVDEGQVDGALGSASWQLGYAKDQRMDTTFSVWATVDPVRPAILQLTAPMGRAVEIGGRQMYTTPNGFVFDLSPTFQVKVEWGGLAEQMEPGGEIEHLLESVVRSLVAIRAEDFGVLEAEAQAHGLSPIDLDCSVYVRVRDLDTGEVLVGDGPSLAPPASVDVEVFATQPLLDVEFVVTGTDADNTTIESAPILRLPSLDESPQPVAFAWDGMIGGAPATAGTYYVGMRAVADVDRGATCRSPEPAVAPDAIRSGLFYTAVTFVVP